MTDSMLRYPDRLLKILNGDYSSFPVTMHIGPMAGCNHDCVWCSDREYRKKYPGYLDADKFAGILQEASLGGLKSVVWIGSGEPTYHPRFGDLVIAAHGNHLAQGLITNGSRIPTHLAGSFSWIRVSLDAGKPETHEKFHRTNDFEKILANVKTVAEEGKTTIGVAYLLTPESAEELPGLVEKFDAWGVNYVQVKRLEATAEFTPEKVEVDLDFSTKTTKVLESPSQGYGGNAGLPCWASSLNTVVGPTGDVFLCCRLTNTGRDEEALIGNLWDAGSFKDVWNGEKRMEVVKRFLDVSTTARCPACWMTRFNVEIDELAADPVKRANALFV